MNSLPLEETACPLCGGGERRPERIAFSPYCVVRCAACGLAYLSPRVREDHLPDLYGDAYFSAPDFGYDNYDAQAPSLQNTFRLFLRQLKRRGWLHAGGRLLEIGCARGWLLEAAEPYFVYRAGTDFSAESLGHARSHADAVYHGGLEAVPAGEFFDTILSFQVLEHVYDPKAFLARAMERLVPGGTFAAGFPDHGSIWRRLLGRRWPSFKIPEHVAFYDRATAARLWRESGLADVSVFPLRHAFPLRLVANKAGVPARLPLPNLSVWLPGTTLVAAGRLP